MLAPMRHRYHPIGRQRVAAPRSAALPDRRHISRTAQCGMAITSVW